MVITQTMVVGEKRYQPLYLCGHDLNYVWSGDISHAFHFSVDEARKVLEEIQSQLGGNPGYEYSWQ